MSSKSRDVSVIVAEGMNAIGYPLSAEMVREVCNSQRSWFQNTAQSMGLTTDEIRLVLAMVESVYSMSLGGDSDA